MESLIEAAIHGHASTRDAMRWLVHQLVPHPSMATHAEVTDAQILSLDCVSIDSDAHGTSFWVDRSTVVNFARAILALRPEPVQMTGEQWTDVLGSAGPDLLDLAKQWSDNKVHVYQVVNEAEKIVKAAVLRGITAQAKKEGA